MDAQPHILEHCGRLALRALLPLGLVAVWSCRAAEPGRLSARLILQPHDTVQFSAEATGRLCDEGRGVVFEGAAGGNGVLLWLHSADSLVQGEYRVLARGDTITPRGTVGAVRYITQNSDRGVTLDSGVVTVSPAPGRKTVLVRGSGIDPSAGQRVVLDASFDAVPIAADTVTCRVQLQQ